MRVAIDIRVVPRKVTVYPDKTLRDVQMPILAEHALEWGLEKTGERTTFRRSIETTPARIEHLTFVLYITGASWLNLTYVLSIAVIDVINRAGDTPATRNPISGSKQDVSERELTVESRNRQRASRD